MTGVHMRHLTIAARLTIVAVAVGAGADTLRRLAAAGADVAVVDINAVTVDTPEGLFDL